jgi:hypothetical protein
VTCASLRLVAALPHVPPPPPAHSPWYFAPGEIPGPLFELAPLIIPARYLLVLSPSVPMLQTSYALLPDVQFSLHSSSLVPIELCILQTYHEVT